MSSNELFILHAKEGSFSLLEADPRDGTRAHADMCKRICWVEDTAVAKLVPQTRTQDCCTKVNQATRVSHQHAIIRSGVRSP